HLGRLEVHGDVAELLVAVGGARRPARAAGGQARRVLQREAGHVAVDVVALDRLQAYAQAVAAIGHGVHREGLALRQRAAHAGERRGQPPAAGTAGLARPGLPGGRQAHLDLAGLRRIADACVGAALVADLQVGRGRRPGGLAVEDGDQAAAVGLDRAEELVHVALAGRQPQVAADETAAGAHRGAVPIEVITLGDLPVDLDPARLG